MRTAAIIAGFMILLLVLRDAFETIVLPRRIVRKVRLTTIFYRGTWPAWRGFANRLPRKYRDSSLSWYGPFSLLLLLACWATGYVVAFATIFWGFGSAIKVPDGHPTFLDDLYMSGTTFFTLGMGDVVPVATMSRVVAICESGLGFGLLAVVIGYLPVIYQAFSQREIMISLLDARAGSPPSAGELLWRQRGSEDHADLVQLLTEWERWSAQVLESSLSYPVLAYFRSQHGNQSWLAALTTVLDTSALVMVGFDGWCVRQARLTFAMSRHAAVEPAQVLGVPQPKMLPERLDADAEAQLIRKLNTGGMHFTAADAADRLRELRDMYEPYVTALATHLEFDLPRWVHEDGKHDNWEGAPWHTVRTSPSPNAPIVRDGHF